MTKAEFLDILSDGERHTFQKSTRYTNSLYTAWKAGPEIVIKADTLPYENRYLPKDLRAAFFKNTFLVR